MISFLFQSIELLRSQFFLAYFSISLSLARALVRAAPWQFTFSFSEWCACYDNNEYAFGLCEAERFGLHFLHAQPV